MVRSSYRYRPITGERHAPFVGLMAQQHGVVGGGERRRSVERMQQREVLGVQVDVSDRHGEHDHPREPFDRARSAGDLTSAWMRWSDAAPPCSW